MNVFTYWHDEQVMPPYIRMCIDIMKDVFRDVSFRCYSRNDVIQEFPNIRPDIWDLRHGRNISGLNETARSDYLRNKILYERGGFWLDADTLVLKDFSQFEPVLSQYDYVGRRNEVDLIGINIIGSRQYGKIMGRYIQAQDKILDRTKVIQACSFFGSRLISDIMETATDYHILPNRVVCPINFKKRSMYFDGVLKVKDVIYPETVCFQLFNRGFPAEFIKMSRNKIMEQNWLISKLFRYALYDRCESSGISGAECNADECNCGCVS